MVPVGWQPGGDAGDGAGDVSALGALLGELGANASDVSPQSVLRVSATSLPRELSVVVLTAQAG